MLQYEIDSLTRTVNKLLNYSRPPETVLIRIDHAKYIGVPFIEGGDELLRLRRAEGKTIPKLVGVKLVDMVRILPGVKSVENTVGWQGAIASLNEEANKKCKN